jgi:hypothetical protein
VFEVYVCEDSGQNIFVFGKNATQCYNLLKEGVRTRALSYKPFFLGGGGGGTVNGSIQQLPSRLATNNYC